MTELMRSGALSLASLVVSVVLLLVGLVLWFFVNRASSRTGEQIALLEAMLEAMLVQQKKQTALLRRLCEANEPEQVEAQVQATSESAAEPVQDEDDFIRIVAER